MGFFLLPWRARRILTAIESPLPRGSAGQAWQPLHPGRHRARANLLQELLRLRELLHEPIHFGHRRSAARGDALAAAGVQDADVATFRPRHRVDDRLDALELALGAREVRPPEQLLHTGDHAEQLGDRPHLLHRAELVPKVLEVELRLAELLLEGLCLVAIVGSLRTLDERKDVPHAEDARGDAIRMEGLERGELLARASEEYRLARHGPQGQGGAAACVALH